MLHDNINISCFMVHSQLVEEERVKRKSRDANRANSFDGGSSKGRLDIQDKHRFKKRFSNQVPSKFSKAREDRVSNHKCQKGRGTSSPNKTPTCGKYGKKHYGYYLVWSDTFLGCVKSGHKVRDFPNATGKTKVAGKIRIVVLMWIFQRRITFIHFSLGVNKKVLPMS